MDHHNSTGNVSNSCPDGFQQKHKPTDGLWVTPTWSYWSHHGYAKQGSDSIYHLITHLWWGGKLGTLMLCVLSQLQLLSGRGVGLLEISNPLPTKRPKKNHYIYYWHHLDIGWFVAIWSFLYSICATITICDLWAPSLVRKNDVVVMDDFLKEILTEQEIALLISLRL